MLRLLWKLTLIWRFLIKLRVCTIFLLKGFDEEMFFREKYFLSRRILQVVWLFLYACELLEGRYLLRRQIFVTCVVITFYNSRKFPPSCVSKETIFHSSKRITQSWNILTFLVIYYSAHAHLPRKYFSDRKLLLSKITAICQYNLSVNARRYESNVDDFYDNLMGDFRNGFRWRGEDAPGYICGMW